MMTKAHCLLLFITLFHANIAIGDGTLSGILSGVLPVTPLPVVPLIGDQQPTGQQNLENVNVGILGLNSTASAILVFMPQYTLLLSNLIANNCPDDYANVLSQAIQSIVNIQYLKLRDILTNLEEMTARPDVLVMVQEETIQYQNLQNQYRDISTNSALMNLANLTIQANNKTLTQTIPNLIKYVSENDFGLLGSHISTPNCICLSSVYAVLSVNGTPSLDSLRGIVDPTSTSNVSAQYFQLETAFNSSAFVYPVVLEQLTILKSILTAINTSTCSVYYKKFFVTYMQILMIAINRKFAIIKSLADQVNLTQISNQLQSTIQNFTNLVTVLASPSVSNADIENVYYNILNEIYYIGNFTFPALQSAINKNHKLASDCLCVSKASYDALSLILPVLEPLIPKRTP